MHPTIQELTKGEFNRFQLVIAASKGARQITDEYEKQKAIERVVADGICPPSRTNNCVTSERALSESIRRIYTGEYKIIQR